MCKYDHAVPPPLGADMRVRDVILVREVLDVWRHETFRRWPALVTDLSILNGAARCLASLGEMGSDCCGIGEALGECFATHTPMWGVGMRWVR